MSKQAIIYLDIDTAELRGIEWAPGVMENPNTFAMAGTEQELRDGAGEARAQAHEVGNLKDRDLLFTLAREIEYGLEGLIAGPEGRG